MNEKNKKIVIGIVVAIGILLLCALCYFASVAATDSNGDVYTENDSSTTATDAASMTSRAQEESANVPDDEQKDFNEITVSEYLDLYEGKEDTLVLFASPTCGYCQIAEPILHHIAYQYNLTINYVDVSAMDSDDQADLLDSNTYFERLGTPSLLVVSNEEIVDSVDGLVDTATYTDFFTTYGFIND